MDDRVKVSVVKYPDREHLILRWRDPITNKWRCKSAGTHKRDEAKRIAWQLEKEILNGQHGPSSRMGWEQFRDYHEDHCLGAMRRKSQYAYRAALNVYERFHKPNRVADITAARVTHWQTELRKQGKSEATIATYTKHLKAVLRWAHEKGLLSIVPTFPRVKRSKAVKLMKGRPITTEEFERMLAVVGKVVVPERNPKKLHPQAVRDHARNVKATVDSWKHYLRGLWWSGLRLSESLMLRWDCEPGALVAELDGRRPMLRIPAESEKGCQDRLLPIAPEFAAFLEETPAAERIGRIFKPGAIRWPDSRMQADWVSRIICRIGRKAGVIVDQRERRLIVDARRGKAKPESVKRKRRTETKAIEDDGIKRKYASAHDLRRAFGLHWAARVMPAVLQQLMRHEDISTTLRYYVGRDAESIADTIWEAVEKKSNKSGNTDTPARSR